MKNNFLFSVSLALGILGVVWCFECADTYRGYNATGGEVFMIVPLLMFVGQKFNNLLKIAERKQQRLSRTNNQLLKRL